MKWNFFLALIVSILFLACNNPDSTSKTVEESDVSSVPEAPAIPYTILNAYPHDTSAFTQGLEFYKGQLYESTGLEGRSTLRTVDLKTGAVKQLHKLAPKEFG